MNLNIKIILKLKATATLKNIGNTKRIYRYLNGTHEKIILLFI